METSLCTHVSAESAQTYSTVLQQMSRVQKHTTCIKMFTKPVYFSIFFFVLKYTYTNPWDLQALNFGRILPSLLGIVIHFQHASLAGKHSAHAHGSIKIFRREHITYWQYKAYRSSTQRTTLGETLHVRHCFPLTLSSTLLTLIGLSG